MGVALFTIVVVVLGFRALLPEPFLRATAPLLAVGTALSDFFADLRAQFADTSLLRRERDDLMREKDSLARENLALVAKIEDLTQFLGKEPAPPLGIIAGILTRPPESPYDTLVIAAGATSGVSPGMRVLAPGGTPLGFVETAFTSIARVTLYSAPGQSLSAWVGRERVAMTLKGKGGGAFTALVPKDAGVVLGDLVYVAGGGALPVGRVREVGTDLSSPIATLSITPLVNLFSLTWVTLVP